MTEFRIPLWLREVGHFLGWAIGIWVVSYMIEANVSFAWSLVLRFVLFWAAIYWTLRAEWREYNSHVQEQYKTICDMLAKSAGIVTASLTAGWWREL